MLTGNEILVRVDARRGGDCVDRHGCEFRDLIECRGRASAFRVRETTSTKEVA